MGAQREEYVVDSKGKRTAVILPVQKYKKLMEDLHDLAMVAERRAEGTITLDEIKKRLKRDGFL